MNKTATVVTSGLKSLSLPVYESINCVMHARWLKDKYCRTNFFELFQQEGDQISTGCPRKLCSLHT